MSKRTREVVKTNKKLEPIKLKVPRKKVVNDKESIDIKETDNKDPITNVNSLDILAGVASSSSLEDRPPRKNIKPSTSPTSFDSFTSNVYDFTLNVNSIRDYEGPMGKCHYKGQLVKGLMHGSGYCRYPRGDIYQGQYVNGLRHGKGTYTCIRSGKVYVGEFCNDKIHGKGQMTYLNGNSHLGSWANNVPSGYGLAITYCNSSSSKNKHESGIKLTTVGNWINGYLDDITVRISNDGMCGIGNMINGTAVGVWKFCNRMGMLFTPDVVDQFKGEHQIQTFEIYNYGIPKRDYSSDQERRMNIDSIMNWSETESLPIEAVTCLMALFKI